MAVNSEGFLVNNMGDLVGEGIQIPTNREKLKIDKDGKVEVLLKGDTTPKLLGKIELVRFENPEGLKSIGGNKLIPTDQSGPPVKSPLGETQILQGQLERPNVNMYQMVDTVLRLNAGYIANLRILKFSDDLFRQAVNLKQ
jgi:flagellar basal-body rod protein FlgG